MDYAAAREIFFAKPEREAPGPPVAASAPSPARRLRDAIEPLAVQAIFSPEGAARYAELGLDDFLAAYVWERVAGLGTPTTPVVTAVLGVFSPGLIAELYERGRDALSRDDVLAVRLSAPAVTVRRLLGGIDAEATRVVSVLRRGIAAADATGRPLFAGLCGEPWPDDPLGQLVHACDLLREHRGDSHLAVCVAACLDPVEMNVLTEQFCGYPLHAYTATRGWTQEQMDDAVTRLRARGLLAGATLSDRGLQFRAELEAQTDDLQRSVVEAIGRDLDRVVGQLARWSDLLVSLGGAPPDPAKRLAG
jgi:hypothetical protein